MDYIPEQRAIVLPLDRAKLSNVYIEPSAFLLSQWQYEELRAEDEKIGLVFDSDSLYNDDRHLSQKIGKGESSCTTRFS